MRLGAAAADAVPWRVRGGDAGEAVPWRMQPVGRRQQRQTPAWPRVWLQPKILKNLKKREKKKGKKAVYKI